MTKECTNLITELKRLSKFLESDGDTNWVRGVQQAIKTLEQPSTDSRDCLKKAFKIYSDIYIGKESFADYFVWDNDSKIMAKKNKELEKIKKIVGKYFTLCASSLPN